MRFRSTAGKSPLADLRTALLAGPAPDGGLYLPERLDPLLPEELDAAFGRAESDPRGRRLAETAAPIARRLFGSLGRQDTLPGLLEEAFDFPLPLRQVEQRIYIFELFHGPTLSFKDVGARFMARLLRRVLKKQDSLPSQHDSTTGFSTTVLPRPAPEMTAETISILVATSGDTGSAVAHAFSGVEPFEVVVLFPRGKISEAQRKLFTTVGGNVRSLAVEGTFDHCQALVKEAFADRDLRSRRRLASANSINVGRFLPQSFYYFQLRNALPAGSRNKPLLISVPSGNFGNLTAGVIARRLGCKIDRLVAATNSNDVVPEYIDSGIFRPRPSQATFSNAMDVGNPSNFARLLDLYGHDLDRVRGEIDGWAFDDRQTLEEIRCVQERTGYLLDPHTAVGLLGLKKSLEKAPANAVGVVLATAHPAKFSEVVSRATGDEVALPPVLRECLDREESVIEIPADYRALRTLLEKS